MGGAAGRVESPAGTGESGAGGHTLPSQPGLHRVPRGIRYLEKGGVKAPPGVYMARMTWDGGSTERTFQVLPDPNDPDLTQDDYDEQFRVTMAVQDTTEVVRAALGRLRDPRRQSGEIV
jgi:hypothetical protein